VKINNVRKGASRGKLGVGEGKKGECLFVMCYIGSSIPRCTLIDSKINRERSACKESSMITIRNSEASAHSPVKILELTRRPYDI
jgi:hypothetical protein